MSLSAAVVALPHEPAETRKLLLLIWAVTVATYLLTGQGNYDKLRAEGRGQFHLIAQTGSNVLVTNRMGQP